MKILVLQLARFGDIYLTWPTLRALRRKFPQAEIHLMVRKRFHQACHGLNEVDCVWQMDTAEILRPILLGEGGDDEAIASMDKLVTQLHQQSFDRIINLSFSPLSSYIVDALTSDKTDIQGYTRSADGFLRIPDDTSAYFYAQVGVGKFNRYHLGEIFAATSQVELEATDWSIPSDWNGEVLRQQVATAEFNFSKPYIVVHVGASQEAKSFPPFKWRTVLSRMEREWQGSIFLLGSDSEIHIADSILSGSGLTKTFSLLGKTRFDQLFAVIDTAELLIGGDSAPVHVAALTETPCLNLSFSTVNFWETGPRSQGSRVLVADFPEALPSDRVATEAFNMLMGHQSDQPIVVRTKELPIGFAWENALDLNWAWKLINAIYSGGDFPVVHDPLMAGGMMQLREVVQIALHQMAVLFIPAKQKAANQILDQVDDLITRLHTVVPEIRPLIDWFQTERVRIAPGTPFEVRDQTQVAFKNLDAVLNLYLGAPAAPEPQAEA